MKIRDNFAHLNKKWCKLDTGAIKKMREAFYEPWNLGDHITDFRLQLKNDQEHLQLNKIRILDKDITQFYVKQMLEGGIFENLKLKE